MNAGGCFVMPAKLNIKLQPNTFLFILVRVFLVLVFFCSFVVGGGGGFFLNASD